MDSDNPIADNISEVFLDTNINNILLEYDTEALSFSIEFHDSPETNSYVYNVANLPMENNHVSTLEQAVDLVVKSKGDIYITFAAAVGSDDDPHSADTVSHGIDDLFAEVDHNAKEAASKIRAIASILGADDSDIVGIQQRSL